MGEHLRMDVSSIRSLLTLVVQLHTIIIFAQAALSEDSSQGRGRAAARSGVTESQVPCCLNGGLCVLGSFCHCPRNFYGRYCEYELKRTPCGYIPHGSWVKAGCNLCRCFDGHMTCLPRAFDGCDDKPFHTDDQVNPWDYTDDMVIIASGDSADDSAADDSYDDYYDSSGGGGGGSGHSGAGAVVMPCGVVAAVVVSVWWWTWGWAGVGVTWWTRSMVCAS